MAKSKFKYPIPLGNTLGSSTGETAHTVVPGGWEGTDDATSTAPSDAFGNPPQLTDSITEGMTSAQGDKWIQSEDLKIAEEEAEAEEQEEINEIAEEESWRERFQKVEEKVVGRKGSSIQFSFGM